MSGQHPEDTPADTARPRGRPRTVIDLDAVADAVAGLVIDGGEKAISIVGAAERLDISRATLYRLVPTKEDLVGIMFERATRQQAEVMSEVVESGIPVRDRLIRLIGMEVEAAVRMRGYVPVFFGGDGLPRRFSSAGMPGAGNTKRRGTPASKRPWPRVCSNRPMLGQPLGCCSGCVCGCLAGTALRTVSEPNTLRGWRYR